MRLPRIKADGAGFYHCNSRIIERRFIFQEEEREVLCSLFRKAEQFSGVQILTYCVLSNHFHVLVYVPERQDLTDEELLERLRVWYSRSFIRQFAQNLQQAREDGNDQWAQSLRAPYLARMYDLSIFLKEVKQRFSTWYNRRNQRRGTLWEERFKSTLIEGSENALLANAVYIDLNPVRAGIVEDPKDYRHCGYGEAIGTNGLARKRLVELLAHTGKAMSWSEAAAHYRCVLYDVNRKHPKKPGHGYDPQVIQDTLDQKGELTQGELLRCRVRYFCDGVVIGSKGFVNDVFRRYQRFFGIKRRDGARAMKYGDWGGLCTIRALRLQVVTPPR